MSIMDDVIRLRAIALSERDLIAGIQQVKQTLLELNAELLGMLGPNYGRYDNLRAISSAADIRLESALAALQDYEDVILDVALSMEQAGG